MRKICVSVSVLLASFGAVQAAPFSFVALGDMAYALPANYGRFEALIGTVNERKPAFSIHVGDIKSGSTPCTDEHMQKILGALRVVLPGPSIRLQRAGCWTREADLRCQTPADPAAAPVARLVWIRPK